MTREERLFIKNTSSSKPEMVSTGADVCSLAVSETPFQGDKTLLKSGSNTDSLKVSYIALSKFGRMLENPSIRLVRFG